MQAIYAYMQAEGSDYLLALDEIEKAFAPDLNSMVVQDRKKLEGQKKIATLMFKEWYETRQFDTEETDKDIREAVNDAIRYYQNQLKKDFKLYGSQMVHAVEKIYDHYLSLLQIMEVVVRLIENEEEKKATRFTEKKNPITKYSWATGWCKSCSPTNRTSSALSGVILAGVPIPTRSGIGTKRY
ncbi:hypothetical protein [Adhaeribacter arboris]|uniref:hypothetical protein n=1 Tax=Adhaeribacter arboris TaxID=2072846 RepID=UPI001E4E128B|nr:hypothetical protein [Adhaeribacter arboris]